jgi:hypothetical protein
LLKFSDAGENAGTASSPVPLNAISRLEFVASLVTVRDPVAAAMEVGAKRICTVAVCPTANELDGVAPMTVKTPPETVAPEIFTAPVPVFVTVTVCVPLLPTATFPNPMLLGEAVRTPPPEVPAPPLFPLDAFVV